MLLTFDKNILLNFTKENLLINSNKEQFKVLFFIYFYLKEKINYIVLLYKESQRKIG